ncbi:MAG: hypothetical protein IT437_00635 [Phycisphaerales bacterium]|nr:hypothetical protein [Phycisphaerales bacterium]
MQTLLGLLRGASLRARVKAISQTLAVSSLAEAVRLGTGLADLGPEILNAENTPPVRSWRGRWKTWRGASALRRQWFEAAVRSWARFGPDARRFMLSSAPGRPEWAEAAQDALAVGPDARRGVAALAAESADPAVLRVAMRLLESAGDAEAHAAEDAARSAADLAMAPGFDMVRRGELEAVVADAARAFGVHRRRGIMHAAITLLDPRTSPDTPLRRWFADDQHESHGVLRSVLRRAESPLSRTRAWWWLGGRTRSIAAAALDRVAVSHGPPDDEAVLRDAHLLASPERSRRVRLVAARKAGGGILPLPASIAALSTRARRGLPRLVAALAMREGARADALAPLREAADPCARFLAMRASNGGALGAYAADADLRVARSARLRLVTPGPDRDERGSDPPARRGLNARRSLHGDREGFIRDLRARIARGSRRERLDAIAMSRRMLLAGEVELDLLPMLHPSAESDEYVASASAAALGDVQRDAARAAIRACLAHPSPRVRANAVESWLRHTVRGGGKGQAILELKGDPNHRVRANAARAAILVAAGSGEDIGPMLGDDRPLHRLAGLWLVERVLIAGLAASHWDQLASRVADLARADPETVVRERAAVCGGRLLAQVRGAWAGRAPALGEGA